MKREKKRDTSRYVFFISLAFLSFALLIARLGFIQIVKGAEYQAKADKQRISEIVVKPPRGNIFDRNMKPLTNVVKDDVCYVLKDILFRDKASYDYIKSVSNMSDDELKELASSKGSMIKVPIDKKTDLEKPRNIIMLEQVSRYDKNNLLSHVIGYVKKSENIGVSGFEKAQNELLTANKTYQTIRFSVDGKNRMIPGLGYQKVNKSIEKIVNSIQLTIDKEFQKAVEEIMDNRKMDGSIIVADASNGDILAMASRPNFDQTNVRAVNNKDSMAFFNKCIRVGYPPASVFKIVVLLAALENDVINFDEIFTCDGSQDIGNISIKCHTYKEGGHGNINIEEAFCDSCNCAFIQLGKRLGGKVIIDTAKRFGLGQKVNIGLSEEEINGNLPVKNELLGPAIGNISIGQGNIEVTPLQITNMMLTVANDGMQKNMSLLKALVLDDGYVAKEIPRDKDIRIYDSKYSDIIKDLLKKVITDGTAKEYVSVDAGGKTGTAQATLNGKNINHSWFSGFYGFEEPKYVVTVLYENKSSGGKYAGSVFEEVIKAIDKID
ncbi:penicillin-binding transpeptidase domain-containing protein [Clostridiaceae bacterium M8S5]|nr:penicillin-binding transpeptidase domain-containing protein [Clostridiaceae bacterium M8S5]